MLRTLAKTSFAYAYTWTGAGRRKAAGRTALPFIVGYHRVVEDFARSAEDSIPSMLISTGMLERHIDWLAKHFEIMSLDDIGRYLEEGRTFRKPAAAITFDDGYADVYENAFPLLKRKGVPSAVFVVTGLAGTDRTQIYDRLYLLLAHLNRRGGSLVSGVLRILNAIGLRSPDLEQLPPEKDEPFEIMTLLLHRFPQQDIEQVVEELEQVIPLPAGAFKTMASLTWDMIAEMHRGGVTIGSHTTSHTLLPKESLTRIQSELSESRRTLEAALNAPVKHFAYPDGQFNTSVVETVKASGYEFAYGICPTQHSRLPLLTIPRKVLWERASLNAFGRFSTAIMNCHAYGVFDAPGKCGHDHASLVRGSAETLGNEEYGRVS